MGPGTSLTPRHHHGVSTSFHKSGQTGDRTPQMVATGSHSEMNLCVDHTAHLISHVPRCKRGQVRK